MPAKKSSKKEVDLGHLLAQLSQLKPVDEDKKLDPASRKKLAKKLAKKWAPAALAAITDSENPVEQGLVLAPSYQTAQEMSLYAQKTLLPLREQAAKMIEDGLQSIKMVKREYECLDKGKNPDTSSGYKKTERRLATTSVFEPQSLLTQGNDLHQKLDAAIGHYGVLHENFKRCRQHEIGLTRERGKECGMSDKYVDELIDSQQDVLSRLINIRGINPAVIARNDLHALLVQLYSMAMSATNVGFEAVQAEFAEARAEADAGSYNADLDLSEEESVAMLTASVNAIRRKEANCEKLQMAEEKKRVEEESAQELQRLKQASQQAMETASGCALESAKKVVFHVAPELSGPSFRGSVSSLLADLKAKNEKLATQLEDFDLYTKANNFAAIKEIFNRSFSIAGKKQQALVNDSYYPYLRLLYKLNKDYYAVAQAAFASLQVSEIDRFLVALSDLKKMRDNRLKETKDFLEQHHITDVALLTNLLVPVYRAVARFEQEHLEPVAKSMLNDKKQMLCAKLDAAKIKLQAVNLSDESSCERNRADVEAYVLGYKTRLEEILSKPKELVQRVEEMCAIEKEINRVFLQPTASMHTAMLTQQKMLIEQKKEKEQEQEHKETAELFTAENFIPEKLPLLQGELVLDVLERLLSHPANVTFVEVQNMLSILRGEGRSVEPVQGHHMFQFPCLWKDYEKAPQVLVAPFHTSGMPTQAKIVDENILRDLRQACTAAGMGNLGVLREIARKSATEVTSTVVPSSSSSSSSSSSLDSRNRKKSYA